MVLSGVPRKTSPVTPPGTDPGIVRQVAQYLNHSMHIVEFRISNPVVHKFNTGLEGINQIHGASAVVTEIRGLQ